MSITSDLYSKNDLVVAKYKEDVSWALNLKHMYNVKIYDKDKHLKNVGRESHTYFYHVWLNYDNLSLYTYFLQGNPFDHCPGILEFLNDKRNLNDYESTDLFRWLTSWMVNDDGTGQHHGGILRIHELYEEYFGHRKDSYIFGAGCQSVVHRKLLLQYPRSWYLEQLEKYETDELLPWRIERIWGYLWERG